MDDPPEKKPKRLANWTSQEKLSTHTEETELFLGFPRNESLEIENTELNTDVTERQQSNNDEVFKKFTLADLIEDTYDRTKMNGQINSSKEKIQNKRPNMDEDIDSGNYQIKRPNIGGCKELVNSYESQSKRLYMDDEKAKDKMLNMDEEIDIFNEDTQTKRPYMDDERYSRDENSLVNMGHDWAMNRPDIDRLSEYIKENLQSKMPKMEGQNEGQSGMSWDEDRLQSLKEFTCEDDNDSHQGDISKLSDHTYCQMPDLIKKEIEDLPDETGEEQNVSSVAEDPLQIDFVIKDEKEEMETSNEDNGMTKNETLNKVDDEILNDLSNVKKNETSEDMNKEAFNEDAIRRQSKSKCVIPLRSKQSQVSEPETNKDFPLYITVDSKSMKKITQEVKKEGIIKKVIRDVPKKKSKSIHIKNKETRNAIEELEELRRFKKQIEETHALKMNYQRKKLEYLQFKHKMEMEMMDLEKRRKEMLMKRLNMLDKML